MNIADKVIILVSVHVFDHARPNEPIKNHFKYTGHLKIQYGRHYGRQYGSRAYQIYTQK